MRQQNRLDDDPTLRRWLNATGEHGVAGQWPGVISAQQAWDSPHAERWHHLTGLYLQMPMDEVQQQLHRQAVTSARQHAMPDLWHPAVALIWPWGIKRSHAGFAPAPAPTAEDLVKWRRQCAELLMQPSRFANALHLTTSARDALVACGMRRVMILMADRTHANLRVHQACGLPTAATSLNVPVNQSTVLQRLLSQQAQLRLTPANNAQISALLPASLRSQFEGEHLLLRSTGQQRSGDHDCGGGPGWRAVLGDRRASLRQNRAVHRKSPAQL